MDEQELRAEALDLLTLAALREPIERERAVRFARAALEVSEVGQLAVAVLDGGNGGTRALVGLARWAASHSVHGARAALTKASSAWLKEEGGVSHRYNSEGHTVP